MDWENGTIERVAVSSQAKMIVPDAASDNLSRKHPNGSAESSARGGEEVRANWPREFPTDDANTRTALMMGSN